MALFSKETITLDPSFAAVVIGSSSSDSKRIGKIQAALLQALTPGEQLIAVAADAQNWGSGVMAVTSQRILYGTGSHIEYIIEGNHVAQTALKKAATNNSKQPFRFCAYVTWLGNPLKHQRIKNFYLSNDFLPIWRADYDEINDLCVRIDRTFGLE
jgi:hypothetical protein